MLEAGASTETACWKEFSKITLCVSGISFTGSRSSCAAVDRLPTMPTAILLRTVAGNCLRFIVILLLELNHDTLAGLLVTGNPSIIPKGKVADHPGVIACLPILQAHFLSAELFVEVQAAHLDILVEAV